MAAVVAASRDRAALKNWVSICCSGGLEQAAASTIKGVSTIAIASTAHDLIRRILPS
jgi:hypothetical protein